MIEDKNLNPCLSCSFVKYFSYSSKISKFQAVCTTNGVLTIKLGSLVTYPGVTLPLLSIYRVRHTPIYPLLQSITLCPPLTNTHTHIITMEI